MSNQNDYTEAQLDLLRRIERMDVSDEMRRDIRELRQDSKRLSGNETEVVRGETRVTGFTANN